MYVLFIRRYLMETGEDGTRVYVDRWPAWLNLEDRVYRPLALTVLPFWEPCWPDASMGSAKVLFPCL